MATAEPEKTPGDIEKNDDADGPVLRTNRRRTRPAAKRNAPKKPQAKPLKKKAAKPSSSAYLSTAELNQLRTMELKKAIGHELKDFENELDQHLDRVRQEFAQRLAALRQTVDQIAFDESTEATPETLEKSTLLDKTAKRLSDFRQSENPSLQDAVKLLKQLEKTREKLESSKPS